MPFAVVGFFLAVRIENNPFLPLIFFQIILCMIFARNAAMAFNRYIDRDIDIQNPRTAIREIPSGIIKPQSALVFVIINSLLFIVTTYFINRVCFFLSPIALGVIIGYSYTKRFTSFCHFVLGLGLSLAPIGSFLAVTGYFSFLPIVFSLAVFFWVSGFDIIYALQDEEYDKSKGLNSVPVLIGKSNALILSSFLHIVCSGLIITAGIIGNFNFWYWIGAMLFVMLLLYQHLIVKPHDLSRVNLAFFTTNGIASIIFCTFVIISLFA